MRWVLSLLPAMALTGAFYPDAPAQDRVPADPADVEFFEKRIRPLLAEHCYQCHGPEKKRSGLLLNSVAAMLQGGKRGPAIVPGMPESSILIAAIAHDGDLRMPPKGKLTERQISDFAAWVRMGAPAPKDAIGNGVRPRTDFDLAERRKHWAYQPVKPVPPPTVNTDSSCRTPIDRFILAQLEKTGLAPAAPVERIALIRRATFDLIGLPPTPQEVEAFLADESPTAFDTVIERLLASPHYGERWGRHWLDLVRYAETLGFEFDYDLHNAWRYRDYVIRAFNEDLPYDRFVVEHLAGDLLPAPRSHARDGSNESILGTGFFWMGEARQTPVDVRQEQADVIDNQIDVLGKAILAQTVACARCHDHKFDAISTRDYYALVGYLKSSRYQQAFLDSPATITAQTERLAALKARIRASIVREIVPVWLAELEDASRYLLAASQREPAESTGRPLDQGRLARWRKALEQVDAKDVTHPLHAWATLASTMGPAARRSLQASLKISGGEPQRFEDFRRGSFAGWRVTGDAFGNGPARPGDIVLGDMDRPVARFVSSGAHSGLLSHRLQGELRSETFTVEKPFVHVRLAGRATRVNFVIAGNTLIMNPIYGKLTIALGDKEKAEPELVWRTIPVDRWIRQRAYLEISDSDIPMHRLNPPPSTARVPEGLADGFLHVERIVFSEEPNPPIVPDRVNLEVLEQVDADDLGAFAAAYQRRMIAQLTRWASAKDRPTETENDTSLLNWLSQNDLLATDKTNGSWTKLLQEYRELESALRAPMRAPALADGTGEDEHVFVRGNYKTPGALASRRLPEVLSGGGSREPGDSGSGRLALARRLVDPANPLLARVLVNRLWQHHFGYGIVRTPDDFGVMGQAPTHPELLDYLATELMDGGWSIKRMHRLMMSSSAYRMSSQPNATMLKLDPENRLLARMNVRRLEAEAIRDAILAASGRLERTLHGPSVLPYLTKHMEGRGRPQSGPLDGEGRRSIYLNVRRNFLTPMLVAFDYPASFATMGRRDVTSVPAQALTLMNDPFVAEQAERWARRVLVDSALSTAARIDALYRAAFARAPTESETQSALAFLQRQSARHEATLDEPPAWTDLCHVLINVKEFIFLE